MHSFIGCVVSPHMFVRPQDDVDLASSSSGPDMGATVVWRKLDQSISTGPEFDVSTCLCISFCCLVHVYTYIYIYVCMCGT